MLSLGKPTGYDIKQFVDKSTRHFWAASYGQIYPELKRLEDAGLIIGRAEPTGGRPRTVYELTEPAARRSTSWLCSTEEPLYELRDEGMLKLFFSDALPERRIENIRRDARAPRAQARAAQRDRVDTPTRDRSDRGLTLELGIGFTEWFIDWCEQAERRLATTRNTE